MSKDKKEDVSDSDSDSEEHVGTLKGKNKETKMPISFYFFILLLLAGFFVLLSLLDGVKATLRNPPTKKGKTVANPNPNPNSEFTEPERSEEFLMCHLEKITQTCPTTQTPPPPSMELSNSTCPDYFRWIHEDLKPWKKKGITKEAIEAGKEVAYFRVVILHGKLYVEAYKQCYQTRDVFTVWGIVQLLRLYPGIIPDLELMFECGDHTTINKADYVKDDRVIPPLFHYCGDGFSFDIPFPDWSFWGWPEINIKPWEVQLKELKEGNERVKWVDRQPFAFWKGNSRLGRRSVLLKCNSTQDWNAQIYSQNWHKETKQGFKQSDLGYQCTHRYKIYMEGRAWSASEKYIQACDSMLLFAKPRYHEFFTRSLLPMKHYWPINPWKICQSLKFAVDWGQTHQEKAQDIGKTGSKFITEDLKMKNIYDYMFHLLSEYGKLFKYKPTVPPGAVEVCLETMACNAFGTEKQYKIESMVKAPSQTGPCRMPQPYTSEHLQKIFKFKDSVSEIVRRWEETGDVQSTIG